MRFWMGMLLLGLACGCSRPFAEVNKAFDPPGWPYADPLVLQVTAPDSQPRTLRLELSLTDAYPYRNIWIQASATGPALNDSLRRIEYILASPAGEWNTTRSWDGRYNLTAALATGLRLQPGQTYTFRVAQYMRTDTLAGVARAQLLLEPQQ